VGGRDRDGMQGEWSCASHAVKDIGMLGGFVAASRDIVDLIVNRARSYIFSTAPTPADAAAALAALRILRSAEGAALTSRLAALIDRVAAAGFAPPGHPSPIIPVVLGREQAALSASLRCWTKACGCRPSARPRCRSAPAVCASPCRPPTATRMSAGCYTR